MIGTSYNFNMIFASEVWCIPIGVRGCKGMRGSRATCMMRNSFSYITFKDSGNRGNCF